MRKDHLANFLEHKNCWLIIISSFLVLIYIFILFFFILGEIDPSVGLALSDYPSGYLKILRIRGL